jgi:hypothetical protein
MGEDSFITRARMQTLFGVSRHQPSPSVWPSGRSLREERVVWRTFQLMLVVSECPGGHGQGFLKAVREPVRGFEEHLIRNYRS